jgi:hypothetical protein
VANGVQAGGHLGDQRFRPRRAADECADHPHHLQDLGNAALVEDDDRVAARDQFGGNAGLQVGEAEDQVGRERLDAIEAGIDERGDARLPPRFRWPHRVAGHADDAIAFAEQVKRLGCLLREADDARRVIAHRLAQRAAAGNASGCSTRANASVASASRGPGTSR